MLFGQEFMNGTTLVRVVALTGKKGQPLLLWEGEPSTDTETVIRQISRNKQIVEWLYKSGRVRQRVATVNLQVQEYAGRKRIATHALPATASLRAPVVAVATLGNRSCCARLTWSSASLS